MDAQQAPVTELVRFHIEHPEDAEQRYHPRPAPTGPSGPLAIDTQAQPVYTNRGAASPHSPGYVPRPVPAVHGGAVYHPQNIYSPVVPEGAARAGMLPGGDKAAIVPGVHSVAHSVGKYPRDALVTLRSAPMLAGITFYLMIVMLAWFVNTVVLVSVRDQPTANAARDETGFLQPLTGPLTQMATRFYYSYGHEAIDCVLALATCWAAVIHQTRQIRACALFATLWVVFSWLIYTTHIFQGLDDDYSYCVTFWARRWCRLSLSNGIFSVLVEAGKVAAFLWALTMFFKRRNQEVYCEMDRNDLEAIERHNARSAEEQRTRALATKESMDTVPTVPLGLAAAAVPPHARIKSLADCRLDLPGKIVLLFCALSTIGFILSMLGNIDVQRLGNTTEQAGYSGRQGVVLTGPFVLDGPVYPGVATYSAVNGGLYYGLPKPIPGGDLNYQTNEVFTALLLFFAIGLSVAAAYDRARETSVNPLMLTFFSSMAMLGYFIYSARRSHLSNNGVSTEPAHHSQILIVVGMGITTCSEILRFFALLWKHRRCAPAEPTSPLAARRIFSTFYRVLDLLLFLTLIAYLIVLLCIQSESGLFQYTPDRVALAADAFAPLTVTMNTPIEGILALAGYAPDTLVYVHANPRYTYLLGQQTAEDALVFPYQVFVLSLLIGAWVIGMNFYARMRDDRVGNFAAFATIVVQCAGWWLMCWPVAYSAAFSEGQQYKIFCRSTTPTSGDYAFGENICDEVAATGRLAIIFWIILMINMVVALIRLLTSPRDLPLMEVRIQAANEVRRAEQGLPARDARVANLTMLHDEKPRHSHTISILLGLAVAGWVIWAASICRQAQYGFFMPVGEQLYTSIGFDLYQFVAVHFITLSFLVWVFVHAHLALHPTLRHFHYWWRFAELVSSLFVLVHLIPVLIFMVRFIDDTTTSTDQTGIFAGVVIMASGILLNMFYCQSLFRRYPLFTTPSEYTHFTRRHASMYDEHHKTNGAKQQPAMPTYHVA